MRFFVKSDFFFQPSEITTNSITVSNVTVNSIKTSACDVNYSSFRNEP